MLNHSADHQFATVKPLTKVDAHLMIMMLITSRNKPNVASVIGMVSMINIGLMKVFSSASTNAKISAVIPLFMDTPGSRYEAMSAASAVTNILPIKRSI